MTTFNPGDRVDYLPAGPDAVPEIVERVDSDGHLLTRRGPREFLYAPEDEFEPAPAFL
jgi:hypothetical protein